MVVKVQGIISFEERKLNLYDVWYEEEEKDYT
jgi:hypothetical protein